VGIAPLFHFEASRDLRLVLAPSLALFRGSVSFEVLRQVFDGRIIGVELGAALGLFFRTRSDFALGPIVRYARVFPTEECWNAFGRTVCDEDPDSGDFGMLAIGLGFSF
jgi:hypothetical protein